MENEKTQHESKKLFRQLMIEAVKRELGAQYDDKDIEKWIEYKIFNKKKALKLKVDILKNRFENCLMDLAEIIRIYKKLYSTTEYFEGKTTLDFNFKTWNKLKKVNGFLTRYYNELLQVKKDLEREQKND